MANTVTIRIERYKQNSQEYLSAVFPFKILSALSNVLVYKRDEDGYQRLPNKQHYLKIKNYILKYSSNFKLPTSIILGVDRDKINKFVKKDECGEYLEIELSDENQIFRIVDGQHRVEGMKEAAKEKAGLEEFPFHVIIIISESGHKSVELEAFIDINSTAKRISTDLATLARFDYEIKEKKIKDSDRVKHIATKTAFHIKEDNPLSVWSSGIKFDIHSEVSLGVVGVTLFRESIENIVDSYMKNKFTDTENKNDLQIIEYYDSSAKVIAEDIDKIWNDIIRKKWSDCFSESVAKNEANEIKTIFYSNEYYIQKTLGVKVLNVLYSDLLKELGIGQSSFDAYKKIIKESRVMSKDWKRGGPFSGLSSESGFARIRRMIKNEISVPLS